MANVIIGKDHGALDKAAEIENYYGFSEPISGKEPEAGTEIIKYLRKNNKEVIPWIPISSMDLPLSS